jgi:hypothetical protein
MLYFKFGVNQCVVFDLWASKAVNMLVTCHGPIGIVYTCLHNRSMDFHRTKTKLYLEASFTIMCSKESVENNLKLCLVECITFSKT